MYRTWLFCFILFTVAFRVIIGQGYQYSRREFDAIREVETGGCSDPLNAVGDQDRGCSYGPYQIMRGYYNDAVEFNPTLRNSIDFSDLIGPGSIEKSEQIMQAYSNRYTTAERLGREPTFEDAARNHNGGPNGYKKSATIGYWNKVSGILGPNKRAAGNETTCPTSSTCSSSGMYAPASATTVTVLFCLWFFIFFHLQD